MRTLLFSALTGFIAPTLSAAQERVPDCTPTYILEQDSELPPILEIGRNETIAQAIERHYNCAFDQNTKIADFFPRDVYSAAGDKTLPEDRQQYVGYVENVTIDEKSESILLNIEAGGFLGPAGVEREILPDSMQAIDKGVILLTDADEIADQLDEPKGY